MRDMSRIVLAGLVALLAFPMLASAALADDPPTPSPRARPPSTVLQHVDALTLEVPPTARPDTHAREVVILVGGYQSCSCIEDDTFDALRTRLLASGFDVVRFGQDPRFPYDTFGHLEPNALSLRDEARDLGKKYGAVHIVTHSMGGVVADRAFADGLSASDGVVTYVAWSGPHDGSTASRALGIVRAVNGDGGLLRDALLRTGNEPDSAASRDLASVHASAPPSGVVRLDLREQNDILVTGWDARDPGVVSRVLNNHVPGLRGVDGHGAILVDPEAIDTTVATIATRRVPPDFRAQALIDAADHDSRRNTALVLIVLCVLTLGLCTRVIGRGQLESIVSFAMRFLPGTAARKRCA